MGANLETVTAELLSRVGESSIEPSLDRIRAALDVLGDPQLSAPVIHITGTNGKTSTARMIESLLRSAGLRTGLYTSPHLGRVTERIRIDGQDIAEERFVDLYEENAPLLELVDQRYGRLSFFEAITALAFAAFADAPVDVMIIEVGLGGGWDATNLVQAAVAVVTPIDIDHSEYLGDSVAAIAAEKAAIIKPGSVAVLGHQTEEAAQVLLRRCAEVDARVAREGLEFGVLSRSVAVGGQTVTLQGLRGVYESLFVPLFGAHQAGNAALALAAVEALVGQGEALPEEVVREGFEQASSPGRLEVVSRNPTVLVDAAHNPAGAAVLAEALTDSFAFDRLIGVIAVLADKDVEGMVRRLGPVLDEVVCAQNGSARALPAQRLGEIAVGVLGGQRVRVEPDLAVAIEAAVAAAGTYEGRVGVLVTGSVVTAGEARALLECR